MSVSSSSCLGASLCDSGVQFRVWAPFAQNVEVHLLSPVDQYVPMENDEKGYWTATVDGVGPGTRYFYRIDGSKERPDPASGYQPEGVHGPSEVIDPEFDWEDSHWRGLALEEFVLYELHIGTFTPGGTFEAAIPRLVELKDLGVTAIELMPVAQFPGRRNWGYDGVYLYAAHNSYGGPQGLKRLVNEAHRLGLAVVLDVVYNHLGPEGNYLWDYGPYFTDRYRTPWGPAVNFDGPYSDEVRRFIVENACYWIEEFHIDALRLDAVHAIFDFSAQHILYEIAEAVHATGKKLRRQVYVIAESALNDPRVVRRPEVGGYGVDAQWNDDFHHSLRTLLTGERSGYYCDFGALWQLAKAYREGFVYTGQYSSYRKRRHGSAAYDVPASRFVVFAQNHDQVGNRMLGERLSQLVDFEALKLAAAAVILSPFIPLLFMGEEYGEKAPFLYFIDHSDPELIAAVREGRKREFAAFRWQGEPPDPQDEKTFAASKLDWQLRQEPGHCQLYALYRELLRIRKKLQALLGHREEVETAYDNPAQAIQVLRRGSNGAALLILNFNERAAQLRVMPSSGHWQCWLNTADSKWSGPKTETCSAMDFNTRTELQVEAKSAQLWVRQL